MQDMVSYMCSKFYVIQLSGTWENGLCLYCPPICIPRLSSLPDHCDYPTNPNIPCFSDRKKTHKILIFLHVSFPRQLYMFLYSKNINNVAWLELKIFNNILIFIAHYDFVKIGKGSESETFLTFGVEFCTQNRSIRVKNGCACGNPKAWHNYLCAWRSLSHWSIIGLPFNAL